MWVRYQQVSSKMASFDPRELVKNKEEQAVQYPIKRFESTLRTSLKVAIPTNLDRLKKHRLNIEKYANARKWRDLNIEQINASRTVQQLQATIRELDKVKNQLIDSDVGEFQTRIAPVKKDALNAIKDFSLLHNLLSQQIQESLSKEEDSENLSSSSTSMLISDNLDVNNDTSDDFLDDKPIINNIRIRDHQREQEEIAVCQSWDHLKDGLVELNSLVKDFAAVVHTQQEVIDRIEDNIEDAHENVKQGTGFLAQATKYKAAAIPVAGALIGGVIAGPIGLMAGFKLAGVATAVGGGFAGYQGGKYLRNKHNSKVEMEMKNMSTNDNESEDVKRQT